MSESNPPQAEVAVGYVRQPGRGRRWLLVSLAGLAVIAGGAYVWLHYIHPPLSAAETQAIGQAHTAARPFAKNSRISGVAQLNVAIEYADKGQCDEARTVLSDVKANAGNASAQDVVAFTKSVDMICPPK